MERAINKIIKLLSEIDGFTDFLDTFDKSEGLEKLCDAFYKYKINNGSIPTSLNEKFEKINIYKRLIIEKYDTNVLYYINPDKVIDDRELDEFRKDWESSKTNYYDSKLRDIQRYKSYREFIMYYRYDADWLLPKYSDSTHPLINATLCRALSLSGRYQRALSFLANGLNYSLRYPHLYWHSKYGMIGCSMILWDLAWMISHRKDFNKSTKDDYYWEKLYKKVLNLLYLTLTRSIDMAPDLPETCDLLSNRADLFYYNFDFFIDTFFSVGFVVSKEIQYIADKKNSFERACKINNLIGGIFLEKLNESKMMYEYGCLHPTHESNIVSPKYIEDDTWDELVIKGNYRADAVSVSLFKDFKNHKLDFCRKDIEEIVLELRSIYYDISPREEFEKVLTLLRNTIQSKTLAKISDLITTLEKHERSIGHFGCYKPIIAKLLILEKTVGFADLDVLNIIEEDYKRLERNYDWKNINDKNT